MVATFGYLLGLGNTRTIDQMIRPNIENEVVLSGVNARKAARVRKVNGSLLRLFIDGAKTTKLRHQAMIDCANIRRFAAKLIIHGVFGFGYTILLVTIGA